MLRCPGVPFLPGTSFQDITKTRYHKSHHLDRFNGIPMLANAERPGIGGEKLEHADGPPHRLPSLYPPYEGPRIPPWLAYDKKVLCFDAYFKETVHEMYRTPYQVRKVKILYYLEDGTMQVSEPRTDNSGLTQGCIVSRQRIPRPPPCQYEFLSILDLNVNRTVRIFDRVYMMTGCDMFTRNFLNRTGISVSDPIDTPPDPAQQLRQQSASLEQPRKPSVSVDTLGQFLENDRKVLQFNAYWDDRDSMYGDMRDLIVYYFLADDTIQIKELRPQNSGRDGPARMLTRQKIPKNWDGVPGLGQNCAYTVLNVLGTGLTNGRYVPDCLNVGSRKIEYYKDSDLTIGASINIYGREIVLIDCDPFTKEYYRKKYGLEDFTPASRPNRSLHSSTADLNERVLPIFNGWGTHEDSEGNCKTVEPKPPKVDFVKFIKLDGYKLRFGAKMISKIKENNERIFIITYYLSDDTIQVYELGARNSGFLPRCFYKRRRFFMPNQEWFISERPKTYGPQHFYLGATVTLEDYTFFLVTADEFCLTYMEGHPFEYPKSNIDTIMNKVREKMRPQYKDFIAKYLPKVCTTTVDGKNVSLICFDAIKAALIDLLGNDITEHEIVTLVRYFSAEQKPPKICNRDMIRSVVHWELNRNLWDNLDRLQEHLCNLDSQNSGYISEKMLYSSIRACRLPLKPVLIQDMFSVLKKNKNCDIEVCDFVAFVDRKCKSAPVQPMNLDIDVCPDMPFTQGGRLVDWNCFLTKLELEEDLKRETE